MSGPDPKPVKPRHKPRRWRKAESGKELGTLPTLFTIDVLQRGGWKCLLADRHECDGKLEAAHVLSKQTLRKRGLPPIVVYDSRNGVCACELAHRRNDSGRERFPAELIPATARAFAEEFGLSYLTDRLYGEAATPIERAAASSG